MRFCGDGGDDVDEKQELDDARPNTKEQCAAKSAQRPLTYHGCCKIVEVVHCWTR